jgi:hypothetical protein
MSSEQTHLLHKGDKAYHLRSGRAGTVLHVSARRGAEALRHAGGEERSYPVGELRARDQRTDDWTMRCRVEEQS